MRVLVTGATGFVASHLLPALARQGHEVIALGHDRARIPHLPGAEVVESDLATARTFPSAEVVVHLAQANVPLPDGADQMFAVNTSSTAALLEYARRSGAARFVFTSSASVYGFREGRVCEDDVPRAQDFYSATKLASERLIAAYAPHFASTIFRLVAPYGPGQRNRLIPALADRVRDGRPITLNDGGRPRMNPIYVEDVVRALLAALEGAETPLVNVAGDETVSIRDLGDSIGETLGLEPLYEDGPGGVAGDLVADNERLHRLLPEPLVPLTEGLRRTILEGARA